MRSGYWQFRVSLYIPWVDGYQLVSFPSSNRKDLEA